jgi:hypothetical protein
VANPLETDSMDVARLDDGGRRVAVAVAMVLTLTRAEVDALGRRRGVRDGGSRSKDKVDLAVVREPCMVRSRGEEVRMSCWW